MARHSAPRPHYAFWSTLGIAGAAAIALTLPPTVVAEQGTAQAAPEVATVVSNVHHTASHDWVSEGYDGSDGSLAAWDCAHGRTPHGYGTEGMTCPSAELAQAAKASELAERQAAGLIADRMIAGQELYGDWTWVGMPPVVGRFNDALLDEWEAAGRPDAAGWLDSYAAQVDA
jgi:hypothetical protein